MKWFALEIDRCFKTGEYGDKKEIYIEEKTDNFIKLKHEKIKCVGSFLKKGRTISTLDSKLFREDGKLAAYATSTWKIL